MLIEVSQLNYPFDCCYPGSSYKLFVKWRSYPGAWLERYLQMAPLSGWLALHIVPLSKNRKKILFVLIISLVLL